MSVLQRKELEESPLADLYALASELGIEGYRLLRREQLIEALLEARGEGAETPPVEEPASGSPAEVGVREEAPDAQPAPAPMEESALAEEEEPAADPSVRTTVEEAPGATDEDAEPEEERRFGVLDILANGSGMVRVQHFARSPQDVYVSQAQIRRCELRPGDELSGPVRPPRRSERHPSLARVETVDGQEAEPPAERPRFEELTPVFASEPLPSVEGLEAVPFGKGSRVGIWGPPAAGATTLLRRVVSRLSQADAGVDVVVVLAGVRPEETTEWRRDAGVPVAGGGFDRPVEEHARAAELVVERAKRALERGRDAAVVVDALDALPPETARRVFAAARNTEEAGSLTVIASTGSGADLQRVATTRIVLDAPAAHSPEPVIAAGLSGSLRPELLQPL